MKNAPPPNCASLVEEGAQLEMRETLKPWQQTFEGHKIISCDKNIAQQYVCQRIILSIGNNRTKKIVDD